MTAAFRAQEGRRDEPLFRDPWAQELGASIGEQIASRVVEHWPAGQRYVALRTAYLDAQIAHWVQHGRVQQVVLLGAGLDMRAWRLAQADDLSFFEVDTAVSQGYKRHRLKELSLPPDVDPPTYVACDFERDDLIDTLVANGFDVTRPAFFVWEGVTMYLTEQAVRATLTGIARGACPRSLVSFDFVGQKMGTGQGLAPRNQRSRDLVAALDEPMRWGSNYIVAELAAAGFRFTRVVTFDQLALHFLGAFDPAWEFRFQSVAVASVDALELV